MSQNELAMREALSVFRAVMKQLAHGVDKAALEKEYRRTYISPGITVRRFVEEMRISGGVQLDGKILKLKPEAAERPTSHSGHLSQTVC